jgi:nitronate monooxygenase
VEVLGVRYPLIQSGMGGVAGPDLAVAVSAAGAAGCLGGYKLVGDDLTAALDELQRRTSTVVGVNLIPEVVGPDTLRRQVEQVLARSNQRLFLFLFGLPEPEILRLIHDAGRVAVVQVGTVADARCAAEYTPVIVAQGEEAGGHLLGTLPRDELVTAIRADLPDVCVVAAGGIGAAEDAARARAAGADGVCAGTAFITAAESLAHPIFKSAVIGARGTDTVITNVYRIGWPGRRHRVLRTAATDNPAQRSQFIGRTQMAGRSYLVPRFSAAVPTETTTGAIAEMAQYCGLSCDGVTGPASAADLVARLAG